MSEQPNVFPVARRSNPFRGYVYFISDGDMIKIGFSMDVAGRMKNLQLSSHRTLQLIAKFVGGRGDELALHEHFAHLKVRGEWFRAEKELFDFIAGLERGRRLIDGKIAEIREAVTGQLEKKVRENFSLLKPVPHERTCLGRSLLAVKDGVDEWVRLNRGRAAPETVEAAEFLSCELFYSAANGLAVGRASLLESIDRTERQMRR